MRIAFAAALLAACLPRLAAADEFTDTVESALQAYRGGDIDGARADLDFASQLLASAKAKGLTTFLPAAPEGWTREEGEDQTAAMAMFGGGVSSAARMSANSSATFCSTAAIASCAVRPFADRFANSRQIPRYQRSSGIHRAR